MNYDIVKGNKELYRRKITDMEILIERAKTINEARESLIAEREQTLELYHDLQRYYTKLRELKNKAIRENDEFRTRRLEHINNVITESLSTVFPSRSLTANLKCDFNRKNTVKLELHDEAGNEFRPHISNGKLMQYLISFSAVCGIAKSLGISNIYVDEAFGVASAQNLGVVGDIIRKKIEEDGFQILLVSQSQNLYMDLPRRQISYKLDPKELKTEVISVEDFDDLEKDGEVGE